MTREEALAECEWLARKHPDRETASWFPQQQDSGEWVVVKLPGTTPPLRREELHPGLDHDVRPDPSQDVPKVRPHSGFGFG